VGKHDHPYKLIFSHPEMVRDLLVSFVPEDWVKLLDFSTLEKQNGNFVTDDLREREDDIIWRVRWGERWLYVYLLIEFQSSTEKFMAVRILTYLGLLYQDLLRTNKIRADEKLPPVLPIVLYNGKSRWTAPTEIGELIEPAPGSLVSYRPALRYLLIDEGAFGDDSLAVHRNAVAALFRLEKSRDPEDVSAVLRELLRWLKAPSQTRLRRDFAVWFSRTFLPGRAPGVKIPEFNDLLEVDAMLSETVIEWTKKWKEEGLAAGRAAGLAAGRAEDARRMLAKGLDITLIAEVTDLTTEELKALKAKSDSVCETAVEYSGPPKARKRRPRA